MMYNPFHVKSVMMYVHTTLQMKNYYCNCFLVCMYVICGSKVRNIMLVEVKFKKMVMSIHFRSRPWEYHHFEDPYQSYRCVQCEGGLLWSGTHSCSQFRWPHSLVIWIWRLWETRAWRYNQADLTQGYTIYTYICIVYISCVPLYPHTQRLRTSKVILLLLCTCWSKGHLP